ncbi:MAG: DUF4276 family protein [Bryobacterales bacterium]|nr:DUF4276 family protein [Bryobacterales bacterium]
MTDLFVLTADTDTLAVMNAVLARPADLGIRPITFEVDRHFGRDPGVMKDGPELVRMRASKAKFDKVVLLCDYRGSGWERRRTPEDCERRLQERLDGVTWRDNSRAIVVVPELETWLCQDLPAVARYLGVNEAGLSSLSDPTERIERSFFHSRLRRKPRPKDFEEVARRADVTLWRRDPAFDGLVTTLQAWFQVTA